MASSLDRDPAEEARSKGLVMFESQENLLMIDLDDDLSEAVFWDNYKRLNDEVMRAEGVGLQELVTTSKSGHKHVYVRLPWRMDPYARIALQASLGSDSRRELLSCVREIYKLRQPSSVLFETREEAVKVTEWLNPGVCPGALEKCIVCHEQYCDSFTDGDTVYGDPIHKACLG